MSAKTHSHQSNRARPKPSENNRKEVFKPVFDNPFRINWPNVPINLQNLILAQTLTLLEGVAEYQRARDLAHRKRKKENKGNKPNKKAKHDSQSAKSTTEDVAMSVDIPLPDQPPILAHTTAGINAVTKRLEAQIRERRSTKIVTEPEHISPPRSPIRVVLVCRADVNPPILIDHIPHLVAAYNSAIPSSADPVLLVLLPQNAELTLAETFGVRRVAVIAFEASAPNLENLLSLTSNVPILSAPWLAPPPSLEDGRQVQIVPTHIKQLRTTAPKDMRVAKEQRIEGRKAAKEKKQCIAKEK
ncbi:RNase P and RNase MRP subunit [Paramarasmius palmivorus]|uniref:RNase P and RNase MRP subunit n=1 Tax=Paramarasmius palmivorus TaxID=297713 RepID=A0AAW0BZ16_9AGAR